MLIKDGLTENRESGLLGGEVVLRGLFSTHVSGVATLHVLLY